VIPKRRDVPPWVNSDETRIEHNESAHPPILDIEAGIDLSRSRPNCDIRRG